MGVKAPERSHEAHEPLGDTGALEHHAGKHEHRQRQQGIFGDAGPDIRRHRHDAETGDRQHGGTGNPERHPQRNAEEQQTEEAAEQKGALHDFFTNYFQNGSKEFDEIVSNGGVKAVYMGHIHAFWAADWRGVRYIISGGGGSPLYPLPPGYPKKKFAHTLRVAVTASGLVETVVPYKGKAFVLPPVKP